MSRAIRQEVTQHESRLAPLKEALARELAELQRQLAAPPGYFDQAAVNQSRAKLRRLEGEIAQIQERLAALRTQLPTAEQVAAAQRRAELELERADRARQRVFEYGNRFLTGLEEAESIGREYVTARIEVIGAIGAISDIANNYGLNVDVPTIPSLHPQDGRLMTNLAAALADLAVGDRPSGTIESYLAAARAERAVVAASA